MLWTFGTMLGMATVVAYFPFVLGNISVSSRWRQAEDSHVPVTQQIGAVSKIHCASKCGRLSTRCLGFCFDAVSSSCYLREDGVSALTTVANDARNLCFEVVATCPTWLGYVQVGGRCGKLNTEAVTWQVASDRCAQDGGHLYHFKSLSLDEPLVEQAALAVGIYPLHDFLRMWTGATDPEQDDSFVWTDGSVLPLSSEVWHTGLPDNFFEDENCVDIFVLSGLTRINDARCSDPLYYLCQYDI